MLGLLQLFEGLAAQLERHGLALLAFDRVAHGLTERLLLQRDRQLALACGRPSAENGELEGPLFRGRHLALLQLRLRLRSLRLRLRGRLCGEGFDSAEGADAGVTADELEVVRLAGRQP